MFYYLFSLKKTQHFIPFSQLQQYQASFSNALSGYVLHFLRTEVAIHMSRSPDCSPGMFVNIQQDSFSEALNIELTAGLAECSAATAQLSISQGSSIN